MAAKTLGVAPWDLEAAPVEWLHRGLASRKVDMLVENHLNKNR